MTYIEKVIKIYKRELRGKTEERRSRHLLLVSLAVGNQIFIVLENTLLVTERKNTVLFVVALKPLTDHLGGGSRVFTHSIRSGKLEVRLLSLSHFKGPSSKDQQKNR